MNDQALGESDSVPEAFVRPNGTLPFVDRDKPLDLEEVMSDARRPERTARILLRPDLLADLDELEAQLEELHTSAAGQGREDTLSDGGVQATATEIQAKRAELAASQRSIRVRAMPKDEWQTFQRAHRKEGSDDGFDDAFWPEMIARCAIRPTLTRADVDKLYHQLGQPALDNIGVAAWRANTADGLDVPKSPLSSAVLTPREPS